MPLSLMEEAGLLEIKNLRITELELKVLSFLILFLSSWNQLDKLKNHILKFVKATQFHYRPL